MHVLPKGGIVMRVPNVSSLVTPCLPIPVLLEVLWRKRSSEKGLKGPECLTIYAMLTAASMRI